MRVRNYRSGDYEAVKSLYLQGDLYGGQFDEARDSEEKLALVTCNDPESILVCEGEDGLLGTISLIENGRVAWLFRFAVTRSVQEPHIVKALYERACSILKTRGHSQILVYSPEGDQNLNHRYTELGMNKGDAYTCFWVEPG